jgi:hypothetical protein
LQVEILLNSIRQYSKLLKDSLRLRLDGSDSGRKKASEA